MIVGDKLSPFSVVDISCAEKLKNWEIEQLKNFETEWQLKAGMSNWRPAGRMQPHCLSNAARDDLI